MTVQQFRYPSGPLYADYARAGAGLALTALPPLLLDINPWVGLFLGVSAALFALFGFRTAQRHATTVEMDADGIATRGPLGAAMRWRDLRKVKLSYYSTRRDRGQGWMQLTLKGQGRPVRLESTLDGFDDIAEQVAQMARVRGIGLSDSTLANFAALGIDADRPDPAAEAQHGAQPETQSWWSRTGTR